MAGGGITIINTFKHCVNVLFDIVAYAMVSV